jgi:hypothetical protein
MEEIRFVFKGLKSVSSNKVTDMTQNLRVQTWYMPFPSCSQDMPVFYEKVSIRCLQDLINEPYAQPDESYPHRYIFCFEGS